ncbi:MAG: addiction module protein [Brachymonas sp.]|nr:addiction module protein [Brachymonas sp.]NJS36207.1 addiction module protein [Brachymonas sp.]
MTTADIIASAQKLSLAERYKIAEALLESIEPIPADIDRAWTQESLARLQAFDQGQMTTGSLETVFAKYRS